MIRMQVNRVDPRDQTWEVDQPRYRVHFHEANGTSDEYEVAGADVDQVIAWAEAHRRERTYVLYVCVPADGLGLVRLAGVDAIAASPPHKGTPDPQACRAEASTRQRSGPQRSRRPENGPCQARSRVASCGFLVAFGVRVASQARAVSQASLSAASSGGHHAS